MRSDSTQLAAARSGLTLSSRSKAGFSAATGRDGERAAVLDQRAGFRWIHEALSRTQEALETLQEAEEIHRLLFEKVPHPRFVCDARTLRVLVFNEAATRHYGYSRDELLELKITDLSAAENSLDFNNYCQNVSAPRLAASEGHTRLFLHRRKDGTLIDVEIDAAPIPLRGKGVILLLVQDVTNKRRVEQRLRAQQAVTQALAESSTLAEASPRIFRAICESLGCAWGELWRVDPMANALRCTQVWPPESQAYPEMERLTRHTLFARGEGIPGTVWARNRPLWITDTTSHLDFRGAAVAARCGLQTVFAFPIRLNREVLGVITVFSRQVRLPDKQLLRLLRDICSQIGQVMGRRRAERQLLEISEREQQRIGQDLHDGLCQQLAGIAYMASDLQARLARKSLAEATIAGRITELSQATATQARQLARGLNPVKLGNTGLMAALTELTATIGAMFSISCRLECDRRVLVRDHEAAVHLYRIAQEAIHNAVTHGQASDIVVSLRREPLEVVLSVRDNGTGLHKASGNGYGMGFENMTYRARAIGARLQFTPRENGGTIMNCTLSSQNGAFK